MPNWCESELEIRGLKSDLDEIQRMWESVGEEGISSTFSTIVPPPKEILDSLKGEGEKDAWYDWRLKNWGVKWEPKDVRISRPNENLLFVSFETPWGPPSKIIDALGKKYPDVTLELNFWESGMQYQGTYVIRDATVVKRIERPYYGHRGG